MRIVGPLVAFMALAYLTLATADSSEALAELRGLSIEDLVNIEVTTVSRQPERLIDAASAIEVITDDDMERMGAFNLPEALKLSAGLQVARADVRTWAISARGFNTSTANKMQVMMDGRLLYTPLYSGIFWDAQNTLMSDIDRIEVVRGPGATLWGSNAVNGVINIITKEAKETQGWLVEAGAGSHHEVFGGLRYGGQLNEATHFRVYGKYESDDELPTLGGADGMDDRSLRQAGFRVDSYLNPDERLTVQGDIYKGAHGIRDSADGSHSGGNVLARWHRIISANSEWELQAYYDKTRRDIPELFAEDRDSFDLEFQQLWEGESDNKLIWGANYHFSKSSIENSEQVEFVPSERETHSYSAFAQYQTYLIPEKVGTIVGVKIEYNTLGGTEIQPNIRGFWRPSSNSTLWGGVARAARKPTQLDTDVRIYLEGGFLAARGKPDFESEKVIAYELGYRAQLLSNLSFDVALFHNEYDDLRSLEPVSSAPFPVVIDNLLRARSNGAEATVIFKPSRSWTLQAGAVFLDLEFFAKAGGSDSSGGRTEGNDPSHWYHLRAAVDLSERWQVAANLRHVGSLPDPVVPSHTDLDVRIGWQATEILTLSLVGQNLFESAHSEFGTQNPDVAQVPRHFFAKATWRF